MRNPFAHSRTENATEAPKEPGMLAGTNRYAVPSETGNYPTSGFGWAPILNATPTATPDSERLRITPIHDYRPDPKQPSDNASLWTGLDADRKWRYGVEFQDADGWQETKTGFGFPNPSQGANRFARNPRELPPKEPRPTSELAPRSYIFERPFMTGQPGMGQRSLNGNHFSMADHRRRYPILGMKAPRRPGYGTRNTYRIEPPPWDADLVDKPPINQQLPDIEPIPAINVPYVSRSWRL